MAGHAPPTRFTQAVLAFLRHWPCLAAGFLVVQLDSVAVAVAWFVACRVAYVLLVGLALRAEDRRPGAGPADAALGRWRRFSARASWLMDNDAIAFVALCVVTAATLGAGIPWWRSIAAGSVLVALGTGVKVWANASLSAGSYHWQNFFVEPEPQALTAAAGPYRWLQNPMYTVGYAHMYGVAMALQSVHGLAGAAFAQAAILLLHALVERPHLHRLRAESPADAPAQTPSQAPAASRETSATR